MAFSHDFRPLKTILSISLVMAIAMTFAQREGWIGRIALLTMGGVAIGFWAF